MSSIRPMASEIRGSHPLRSRYKGRMRILLNCLLILSMAALLVGC